MLWGDGCPAGYVELDLRCSPEIEIACFRIMREYRAPTRLWVHTCNLDHQAALPNYQRFTIYKIARVFQAL